MSSFEKYLKQELGSVADDGLWRELRRVDSGQGPRVVMDGREVLNFSSNDYLGLAVHATLREAAQKAVDEFGTGSGAARLISGSLAVHHELEAVLAEFKGTEAALSFATGYATAGVIPALVGKGDTVVIDKLAHACLVDAARASGARLRVFKHNDLDHLERILEQSGRRDGQVLVVTESVFSMDGDIAPLLNLVELKERHGAWLMVDEAHATGLYGEQRRGMVEEFAVADLVEVQMGTLGKALGAAGGYVCGTRTLVDLLVNRARPFMFSTAPVPAQAAAARAGVELAQSAEGEKRRTALWSLVDRLKNGLIGRGWKLPPVRSAILPLIVEDEALAVELSRHLLESGVWVPAIRYPTVARGAARLRLTVSAAHAPEDIDQLLEALGDA
ncbi:MAG: 8-amino-7-oxononanoate synthase [Verrucomicrobiales bacterium]|nr:8-amino-7-oxononanoate synthase [Verrucomicrobiales bacterium]